ncbi:heme-dependent oxidative N-demethylase family protein [Pseudosulfitobacter pseudonitzschiae]|uniref:heme-dependent oxidative N-demethylase family protein n=1 Tax=Pseudosulfitobacter pseudonitzschiae TaxID=1402135 RepID=UPI001AF0B672|nr:DUF3445 domain-containing protein [Pseudosulfitobacter pseudonitzschiae]MBM1813528.1 DUF3445 domain-containing protein [Pseudosulfitobacter pseudonitzschiae]MBM1830521.1 DUF3445 domain-containing protein [Pseudosulfitobacter pseudonitzschiae]MBM1835388.1 DUF3445 domain-containing protein [Pseudosulfitobacter pseudonitzschiae]MBM1840234.1 DUF3445 domain-containing protein [Pseudosulfitobacter pseudonitzschiae]MBM1845778.1 DUF3445 domain-containing protein [Pseudosulfitobacter pseudonitzschia
MTILHHTIPYDVTPRALPGIQPVTEPWLRVDEAYAGQMARRCDLLGTKPDKVLYLEPQAHAAAVELLEMVLERLPDLGFAKAGEDVTCPDGRRVTVDRAHPMATLGRLVQCDFVLLDKRGAEHVLTGAVLCFPASWRLDEKAGRPLMAIHDTVASYDENIAKRVQRLFDGIQAGRPLWRFNALWYDDPELHQPRSVTEPRHQRDGAGYFRSERQTLIRLPQSGTVVFAIHTYVLRAEDVAR